MTGGSTHTHTHTCSLVETHGDDGGLRREEHSVESQEISTGSTMENLLGEFVGETGNESFTCERNQTLE